MAAMEAQSHTRPEPNAGRAERSASLAIVHQRAWPVVERRCLAHERSLSEVFLRPHGVSFAAGGPAALLVGFMNRRMRNRTSGGVGGRRE
jgi:hypothetical protein